MDKKLDCCVVRDLERDTRPQVPMEKAPKGTPNFLKRVKRTRLIAAGVTLALTLWCIWWLYNAEFHYPNTEAGRLAAVEDYIADPEGSGENNNEMQNVTPLAWQESHGKLFIFYKADSRDNVHGIIQLTRGFNGKYRTDHANMDPFPYTAGVIAQRLDVRKIDWSPIVIAGDNCREIYSVAVEYTWFDGTEGRQITGHELIYPLPEVNFFWLLEEEDVREQLGVSCEVRPWNVRFLDKNGNDITEQYRDNSVQQNWVSSKSTAEQFLLYVYIGIAAALGLVFICYFLRRD